MLNDVLLMCYTKCRRQKERWRECNTASDNSSRNTAAAERAVKLRGCAVPTIACRGRACPTAYCGRELESGHDGLDLKPFKSISGARVRKVVQNLQVELLIEVAVGKHISQHASVCPAVAGVLRPGIGSLHNVNLAIAEVAYHVDHPPTGFRGLHIEPVARHAAQGRLRSWQVRFYLC